MVQTIYDIIKPHGGELKVESKEGQCSEFIVILPNGHLFQSKPTAL